MHHRARTTAERTRTERSTRPALNPYYVDDVAMTLTDVVRARAADGGAAAVR